MPWLSGIKNYALANGGSVVECQPANQRVVGTIPSLGHMPGLRAKSPVGGAQEATTC